jgi:hypothetical protein
VDLTFPNAAEKMDALQAMASWLRNHDVPNVVAVKTGNIYKYVLGKSSSREEAAGKYSEIKKKFPESFIVKVSGNNVERL